MDRRYVVRLIHLPTRKERTVAFARLRDAQIDCGWLLSIYTTADYTIETWVED